MCSLLFWPTKQSTPERHQQKDTEEVLQCHVLLRILFNTRSSDETSREFAFKKYFETASPIDNADPDLNYLGLQSTTAHECEPAVSQNLHADDCTEVGQRNGVIGFSSIKRVHLIVRSNHCVSPFSPWFGGHCVDLC